MRKNGRENNDKSDDAKPKTKKKVIVRDRRKWFLFDFGDQKFKDSTTLNRS
jgi:hypothetical protein